MTGAQATLGSWAPTAHDRRDDLDDDLTPRAPVRAVLEAALVGQGGVVGVWETDTARRLYWPPRSGNTRQLDSAHPLRVLDIGAGFGCWSSEMRRLAARQGWPVHITGVEINPARREHLVKWCDEVAISDWRWLRPGGYSPGPYDLIIGNPPFAHLLADGKGTDHREDPAETMVPTLLEHAPTLLLLHTQQALLKSECGRAVQRLCPPAAAWQVPGAVAFRGDGKADSRCYEATLWLRGHSGPCSRYLLPELTAAERRWTVPPGSESLAEARGLGLPLAPGYEVPG